MKTCTCGGKMYRHSRQTLKTGGETQRFRCNSCNHFETFFRYDEESPWIPCPAPNTRTRAFTDDATFRRAA